MEIGISVALNDKSSEYFLVRTARYRTTNISIEIYIENFIISWLDVLNSQLDIDCLPGVPILM